MRVVFRPEARLEALEATSWYDEQVAGLGSEFARALDAVVQSIARIPEAYPLIEGECRRALLRRFPFSVIFRMRGEELLVVAVFHQSREPQSWLTRVGGS